MSYSPKGEFIVDIYQGNLFWNRGYFREKSGNFDGPVKWKPCVVIVVVVFRDTRQVPSHTYFRHRLPVFDQLSSLFSCAKHFPSNSLSWKHFNEILTECFPKNHSNWNGKNMGVCASEWIFVAWLFQWRKAHSGMKPPIPFGRRVSYVQPFPNASVERRNKRSIPPLLRSLLPLQEWLSFSRGQAWWFTAKISH